MLFELVELPDLVNITVLLEDELPVVDLLVVRLPLTVGSEVLDLEELCVLDDVADDVPLLEELIVPVCVFV